MDKIISTIMGIIDKIKSGEFDFNSIIEMIKGLIGGAGSDDATTDEETEA